jgi:molecular chaperone DnaK (HSP70)
MGHKIAIDFGTTNSVVAVWDEANGAARLVSIPGMSGGRQEGLPVLALTLKAQSPEVRVHALELAAATGTPEAIPLANNWYRKP